MAVKIKLKRLGKIRSPHYRIVVADSRTRRDGRAIADSKVHGAAPAAYRALDIIAAAKDGDLSAGFDAEDQALADL
ncbi:30S ribosomal protein S16, partial [Streptomyces sp. BE282]|uniref:30S ribosomal protein S16 n=1 Tax=Streptomyces sp. BE282 TaxID=3002527 RepID=UPI002E7772B5